VVDSIDEAIHHINHFGSHHSDSIITDNRYRAQRFLNEIDSAAVFLNASSSNRGWQRSRVSPAFAIPSSSCTICSKKDPLRGGSPNGSISPFVSFLAPGS